MDLQIPKTLKNQNILLIKVTSMPHNLEILNNIDSIT